MGSFPAHRHKTSTLKKNTSIRNTWPTRADRFMRMAQPVHLKVSPFRALPPALPWHFPVTHQESKATFPQYIDCPSPQPATPTPQLKPPTPLFQAATPPQKKTAHLESRRPAVFRAWSPVISSASSRSKVPPSAWPSKSLAPSDRRKHRGTRLTEGAGRFWGGRGVLGGKKERWTWDGTFLRTRFCSSLLAPIFLFRRNSQQLDQLLMDPASPVEEAGSTWLPL